MKLTRQEDRMKKMLIAAVTVLLFSFGSWPKISGEPYYVNLSFAVWQSKRGPADTARMIYTPIPIVLRDSWCHDLVSLDLSGRKPQIKIFEKENPNKGVPENMPPERMGVEYPIFKLGHYRHFAVVDVCADS